MKYQRYTPSVGKDIGIRKFKFVCIGLLDYWTIGLLDYWTIGLFEVTRVASDSTAVNGNQINITRIFKFINIIKKVQI